MKIIYQNDFKDSTYATNPAASAGRIECILDELEKHSEFEFVEPKPAKMKDLKLVHAQAHIEKIKRRSDLLFRMSKLAAGGSIKAAEIAQEGVPTFALIRPPGHHASPNSAWGFCYFNNMGITIERLIKDNKIDSAYILDFDLHTGDGNINALESKSGIKILNPRSGDREKYIQEVKKDLKKSSGYDIIGVSAGFDEHVDDWGGKLTTKDYKTLGEQVKKFAKEECQGKRFAILEGGYNHNVLGKNVVSFLKGLKD